MIAIAHHHHLANWWQLLLLLVLWIPFAVVAEAQIKNNKCPVPDPTIRIAGTRSMQRIAQAWKEAYEAEQEEPPTNATSIKTSSSAVSQTTCPNVDIRIETDGFDVWATGAARVCDVDPIYGGVDMAGMYGGFFHPQAVTENGWHYQCRLGGDEHTVHRETILIDIGHEGILVVVGAGGTAAACIQDHLGGALETDQLRWMFSSFDLKLLAMKGEIHPERDVPGSDGNDDTHLWSELHENCSSTELLIAHVSSQLGAYEYMMDKVLIGQGETMGTHRQRTVDDASVYNNSSNNITTVSSYYAATSNADLVSFLAQNGDAIAILELSSLVDPELQGMVNQVWPVPIRKDEDSPPIPPVPEAFEAGTYPLSRDIYMGLHDDPNSLALTKPFVSFGFSERGTEALRTAGYWPLDVWEQIVMQTRLQMPGTVPLDEIQASCGDPAHIAIAGSSTVFPIARIWSQIYMLGCPFVSVSIDGGGSSAGAERICMAWPEDEAAAATDAVDIGTMSRDWTSTEGTERDNGFVHDCLDNSTNTNTGQSTIKMDVAYDGISIVLKKGGIGDQCQKILGGFTVDQLRWIFSGYSEDELEQQGDWDASATTLLNSDMDPTTHLWSELHPGCAAQEIRLAGDHINDGGHAHFRSTILIDEENGEDIDLDRPLGYYQADGNDLVLYVRTHADAIAYLGYNYYFENQQTLSAAAIENKDGHFVHPSVETIGEGSYNPLVRSIYMNILNKQESLVNTVPLLLFGYAHPELAFETGMVPLQGEALAEMEERLHLALSGAILEVSVLDTDADHSISTVGLVLGIGIPCIIILGLCLATLVFRCYYWV